MSTETTSSPSGSGNAVPDHLHEEITALDSQIAEAEAKGDLVTANRHKASLLVLFQRANRPGRQR